MRFRSDAQLDASQVQDRRGFGSGMPYSPPRVRPAARPTNAIAIAADVQKRVATGFGRWAPGILGGRTNVASPVSPTAQGSAVPTTVAGAGAVWARLQWIGGSVADNTPEWAGNGDTWNAITDDIGLTIETSGLVRVPAGLVVGSATADWAHSTLGQRYLELALNVTFGKDECNASSHASRGTAQNVSANEVMPANAGLIVNVSIYGAGSSLGVDVYLNLAFWAD